MSDNKTVVLYVEDEAINLLLFSRLMETHFEILTAISGEKALNILEERPDVDIVITDLKMPKMNGMEFIRVARKKFEDRPYLILSGFSQTEEIEEAMEQGLIQSYMQKPFNSKLIIEEVEKALCKD